jgi:uncharacterized membrane protein (UPF0127 family)
MSHYIQADRIPLFENFCRRHQVDGKKIRIEVGGTPLDVTVASTPRSQAKGYMGAESEPSEGTGILFVYDLDAPLSFWMKNVKFPLDIMFFDSNFDLVDHQSMEPADDLQDHIIPRYTSSKPARFAIEVKSGWCKKNLTPGCKLKM